MARTRWYLIDGVEVRIDDIRLINDTPAIAYNGMPDWQISVNGVLDPTIHRLIDHWFTNGFADLELDEYLDSIFKKPISRRVK